MIYDGFNVSLDRNSVITMKAIPGHFTTNHFHMTHYLDLEKMKKNALIARDVAVELVKPYLSTTIVDTIICLEGTEVIGAYLAEELMKDGRNVVNSGKEIYVVTPISNVNKNLMFQSNMQKQISSKNIIVLLSSVSSGITMNSALECLTYYGGNLVGVSALYDALPGQHTHVVNSLFTSNDIPGYKLYQPSECPLCKHGRKLDAIIVHDGYITI